MDKLFNESAENCRYNEPTYQQPKTTVKEKIETFIQFRTKVIIPIVLVIVSLVGLYQYVANGADSSNVKVVQSSKLTYYSNNITIGDAFNNFFSMPRWAERDKNTVSFKGICNYKDNKDIDVTIIFKRSGKDFKVSSMEFNGIEQDEITRHQALCDIFGTN